VRDLNLFTVAVSQLWSFAFISENRNISPPHLLLLLLLLLLERGVRSQKKMRLVSLEIPEPGATGYRMA
jgi:hypothetical protein